MNGLSRKLAFDRLNNSRDLGGIRSKEGSVIREGCFIRSGQLSGLTDSDKDTLKKLVGTVIDFRTDMERKEKPDEAVDGIEYIHIPVMNSFSAGITREKSSDEKVLAAFVEKPEEAKAFMCGMYRGFAADSATAQYSGFVRILLGDNDKAVLWHCTAGKDRAGVAAAIIEEILGIPRETIIADYMTTNEYIKGDIDFLTRFVKEHTGSVSNMADEALHYLFGAREEYIMTYYNAVEERYGSFAQYIRDGLGLSDEDVDRLKNKYMRGYR